MEVGFPGTWGLELLTPNPGSKSTPKACPTRNPAMSLMPKASGLIQMGDGGSWHKSHSPQGAGPEAPKPSKRKPANATPAPLIET